LENKTSWWVLMVGFCTYMQVFAYIRKQEGNLEKLLKTLENTINKEIGFVAQLDRASDFGSEGWGFESLQGH
jgi:hypothetical protein